MNEMGSTIMRLRKARGMTQEQLANELGISFQAVSKWENNNSCPDIATLPLLADLFSVSIDELFGRSTQAERIAPAVTSEAAHIFPWPDDNTFYAVLFHGHELIGSQAERRGLLPSQQKFCFQYEGPAQNIQCAFDLQVNGTVYGGVSAKGDVSCGDVAGGVEAQGDVSCGNVGGAVNAAGDVSADSVYGNVCAGGDVSCDDVNGDIQAGGDVSCDDVTGSVSAGGDVNCNEIRGSAFAGGDMSCESLHRDREMDREPSDLGNDLSETLSDLGDRISDAMGKSAGKSWPFSKHQVEVDLNLEED